MFSLCMCVIILELIIDWHWISIRIVCQLVVMATDQHEWVYSVCHPFETKQKTIYNLYLPSASVSGTKQTTVTDDSNWTTGRRQTSWLFTNPSLLQTEICNQQTVQTDRKMEWITSHQLLRCNSTIREQWGNESLLTSFKDATQPLKRWGS